MKTTYSISIPKPCAEDWDTFSPQNKGRHCGSCNKVVIDFTKMSDRQILEFLENRNTKVCGRFRTDQMKSYEPWMAPKINPGLSLLKAGLISFIFALIAKESSAGSITTNTTPTTEFHLAAYQTRSIDTVTVSTITGTVISKEDNTPMPGVSVQIKGTTEGAATDVEGKFSLQRDFKPGDILVFSFIGFKQEEYVVTGANTIEIQLTPDTLELMGELLIVEKPSIFARLWYKFKAIF